jgi:hypothetical protein
MAKAQALHRNQTQSATSPEGIHRTCRGLDYDEALFSVAVLAEHVGLLIERRVQMFESAAIATRRRYEHVHHPVTFEVVRSMKHAMMSTHRNCDALSLVSDSFVSEVRISSTIHVR